MSYWTDPKALDLAGKFQGSHRLDMSPAPPASRGATLAAGLISFALFLACLAAATWLIVWTSEAVYGVASHPGALDCRLYGSVWDLPVTSYAPCTAKQILVWWQAADAFMEIDFQPGMAITARVLWHLAEGTAAILACVLIPGSVFLLFGPVKVRLVPERREPRV